MARQLLLEEIERIVADTRDANEILSVGHRAGRLLHAYPSAGMSLGRIIDELVLAAARVGVGVEISRPD